MSSTIRHRSLALALTLLSMIATAPPSSARTLEVKKNGTKEFSVLQDALSAAAPGDTVLIHAGAYAKWTERWDGGTFRRAVGFVESGVTIIGTSYAAVIRAPNIVNSVGLYSVAPDSIAVLGLRFQGGLSTGVFDSGAGNALVDSCLFEGTSTGVITGALDNRCWVRKCEFRDSEGVIVNAYGWAQIRDCISNNLPGFLPNALLVGNGSHAEMFDCTITNGGVVQVNTGSSAVVRDVECTGTRAGALVRDPGSTLTLDRISFDGLVSDTLVAFGVIIQNDGTLIAKDLSITNMWRAIQFESAGRVTLTNSHILNWDQWAVISLVANEPPMRAWDLTGNWWGTTDSTAISGAIWDGEDDQALNEYGIVDFWPIAPGPVPTREDRVGSLKAMYLPRRQ